MAGGIFISYRRDDSRHAAGRLVDRLAQTYARDQLFMDVDNIDLGLDFVKVLGEKVAACEVMLVVIGPQWLDARDAAGNRRLEDPNDFVRIEVEQGLARDVRVIPVLVDGAAPPTVEKLPPSMQSLARRQATRISHERFGSDAETMVDSLARVVPPRRGAFASMSATSGDLGQTLSGFASGLFGTAAKAGPASAGSQSQAAGADMISGWLARIKAWTLAFFYGLLWFYAVVLVVFPLFIIADGSSFSRSDRETAPGLLLLGLGLSGLAYWWRTKRLKNKQG